MSLLAKDWQEKVNTPKIAWAGVCIFFVTVLQTHLATLPSV